MACYKKGWEEVWEDARVIYEFDDSLPEETRANIRLAMDDIEGISPLRFRKRDSETHRIFFKDGDRCATGYNDIQPRRGKVKILLAPDCGRPDAVHEILHGLGFIHEHSRLDRDDHVEIHWDNIDSGKHNFRKWNALFDAGKGVDHGDYDFDSIMHYDSRAAGKSGERVTHVGVFGMTSDGTIGLPTYDRTWTTNWSLQRYYAVGGRTYLFLLDSTLGEVAVHAVSAQGLGDLIAEDRWSSGWTTAEFFEIGGTTFLFALQKMTGKMVIRKVKQDGKIGGQVDRADWSGGWSHVRTFTSGGRPYLFLHKTSSGEVRIREMNSDGTVGDRLPDDDWTSGWSSVEFFEAGGETYLFLLRSSDGQVHIHRMNEDGRVGSRVYEKEWRSGWTAAGCYVAGGDAYLFLHRASNGGVEIRRLHADGTVGPRADTHSWIEGQQDVRFFSIGSNLHMAHMWEEDQLLMTISRRHPNPAVEIEPVSSLSGGDIDAIRTLYSGTYRGDVHIHRIDSDGKVGDHIRTYHWSRDWSAVRPFSVGGTAFLFLLKESDGTAQVHRVNYDGTTAGSFKKYDWTSGWTTVEFYSVGGKTFLFLLKSSSGEVHIHEMNTDGTVGTRVTDYDWSDGVPGPLETGWTTAEFFETGGHTFLFRLQNMSGKMITSQMRRDGTIGDRVDQADWSGGWSHARLFTSGGKLFLFLLKKSSGEVHTHEMKSDGSVGDRLPDDDWTGGWTTAEFFYAGGETYLFLLKRSSGDVHVHRMKDDGTVGTRVDERNWTSGWTTAEFYEASGDPYLFLLKK